MGDETARPGGVLRLGDRTVARIGYGAMALERYADDRAAGVRLLHRAVELGVDHIDTADFYGQSVANDIVRRALGTRDDVLVVTKVGAVRTEGAVPLALRQRPAELRAQVEDNLRTLGRDRLDVVNLRRADVRPGLLAEGDQLVPIEDQLAEMTAMRDEGLIGGIGLSAVTDERLRVALPAGIVCVQNGYSLVARDHESMLARCAAEGIAWVPYFPLGGAFPGLPKVADDPVVQRVAAETGATTVQIGLAWLLGHAPQVAVIPGTASISHLEQNVAAGGVVLDHDQTAALDAVWTGSTGSVWPPAG